jgi:hypothetical protein
MTVQQADDFVIFAIIQFTNNPCSRRNRAYFKFSQVETYNGLKSVEQYAIGPMALAVPPSRVGSITYSRVGFQSHAKN